MEAMQLWGNQSFRDKNVSNDVKRWKNVRMRKFNILKVSLVTMAYCQASIHFVAIVSNLIVPYHNHDSVFLLKVNIQRCYILCNIESINEVLAIWFNDIKNANLMTKFVCVFSME